ncbi:hypothetical protein [Salaquimonas pukyongi]|uniref:hypothetical protein n=1 Tax=Salaquimonas pukyongi TaxID=2712698 RepID=UPI00096BD006|nr:hypothetical protein [Salaquimonas pukyongi]
MTKETKKGKRPTYEIFHVTGEGDEKARWVKVGAAWINKNEDYLFIDLKYLPLEKGRLVGQKYKPKDDQKESSKEEAQS